MTTPPSSAAPEAPKNSPQPLSCAPVCPWVDRQGGAHREAASSAFRPDTPQGVSPLRQRAPASCPGPASVPGLWAAPLGQLLLEALSHLWVSPSFLTPPKGTLGDSGQGAEPLPKVFGPGCLQGRPGSAPLTPHRLGLQAGSPPAVRRQGPPVLAGRSLSLGCRSPLPASARHSSE